MADKTITVREGANATVVTYKMTTFRDESAPSTVVDITNYSFQLIVKRDRDDADSSIWFTLAGAIVSASAGTFKFTLTAEHTNMPAGTYAAEIVWVTSGGFGSGIPYADSWSVDYVVTPKRDQYP